MRKRGYASDHEEHTIDSSCLAVPIYDYTRNVMAAMSISAVRKGVLVMQTVAVKKLNPKARLPVYGSEFAAGADLCACLDAPVTDQNY